MPTAAPVGIQEGTESATLPPSAPATGTSIENGTGKFGKGAKGTLTPSAPATGTSTENGTGKFGKGAKGKNGLDKSWTKSEKSAKTGKGKAGAKSGDKLEKSKGKGGKGGQVFFNYGNQRRLQKIEYHQSRIEFFKELLMHVED